MQLRLAGKQETGGQLLSGHISLSFCIGALLILVLSCSLFWCSYLWDNKYTSYTYDSEPGLTWLDQQEYQENPFLYLIDNWLYYDGKILDPTTVDEHEADTWFYIGRYGGFELGDGQRNPHGCGTYRMTVITGAEERQYALEVPEIFSRYRIYINGILMETHGMGDEIGIYEASQRGLLTFYGQDSIEILIAAADDTGFYSGLVYPPAFGSPYAVGNIMMKRLLFHIFEIAAALVIGVFWLFAGWKSGYGFAYRNLFFLSLAFAGCTTYPLIQALGLHWGGWNVLERFCYYGLFLTVVSLHGKLGSVSPKMHNVMIGLGWLICLAVLIQPFIPVTKAEGLYVFSRILSYYKWTVAFWLLGSSLYSLIKGKVYSRPVFMSALVFASALVMDRLLPFFEPIRFGWHVEWAGFFALLTGAGILWNETSAVYLDKLAVEKEKEVSDLLLKTHTEYVKKQQQYVSVTRKLLHDNRNHLSVLRVLAAEGEVGKLRTYLDELLDEGRSEDFPAYSANELLNVVLGIEFARIKEAGFHLEYDLEGLEGTEGERNLPLADKDLSSLLMNILDNAIEAVSQISRQERQWIYLSLIRNEKGFIINCQNGTEFYETNQNEKQKIVGPVGEHAAGPGPEQVAASGREEVDGPEFVDKRQHYSRNIRRTSKKDTLAHGYGLPIIHEIAKRYDGEVTVRQEEDSFDIDVMIPVK